MFDRRPELIYGKMKEYILPTNPTTPQEFDTIIQDKRSFYWRTNYAMGLVQSLEDQNKSWGWEGLNHKTFQGKHINSNLTSAAISDCVEKSAVLALEFISDLESEDLSRYIKDIFATKYSHFVADWRRTFYSDKKYNYAKAEEEYVGTSISKVILKAVEYPLVQYHLNKNASLLEAVKKMVDDKDIGKFASILNLPISSYKEALMRNLS